MLLIPGPVEVPKSVQSEASVVVNHRSDTFRKVMIRLEENLKSAFNASRVAVLSGSGTLAVESMVFSMTQRSERVVGYSYGEFGNRLLDSLERRGVELHAIRKSFGEPVSAEDVKDALDRYSPSTIALVHNETSSGTAVRNLKEIARITREKGIKLLVDSVSGFGAYELFVNDWGIDAVATGSQKALASVPGLSFVAVKDSTVKAPKDIPAYLDLSLYLKFQDKGETPFTAAVGPTFASLRASEILNLEGKQRRWERHEECVRFLRRTLEEWGIGITGNETTFSNTVVSIFPGMSVDTLVSELRKDDLEISKGIGEYAAKMARIGVMGIIDGKALETLLASMSKIYRQEYTTPPPGCFLKEEIANEAPWY